MSRKDQLVVFLASVVVVAALGAGSLLLSRVNAQREQLELTVNPDVYRNMPPKIAITQTALGGFRVLALDIMWQRLWAHQQAGRFEEADQLSKWITTLQPRYAEVWANRAWNMSYNISVSTHTPQERWMWVQSGIELLRGTDSEAGGIELNPTAIKLYKELAWIFLHKIGQFSDEMHKYYKQELALQWHELLGAPPIGTAQDTLDGFAPIAEAHALAAGAPASGGEQGAMLMRYEAAHLQRYLKARPDVADQVRRIEEMGYDPDEAFLRDLGRVERRRQAIRAGYLPGAQTITTPRRQGLLLEWIDAHRDSEPGRHLLAFIRAKVLATTYRMDPSFMMELMRGEWLIMDADNPLVDEFELVNPEQPIPLPLDWRHPAAHGLYWSALGVRTGQIRRDDNDHYITMLNTDRQVLHALQALTHIGRITFDPITGHYAPMPDIRYIPAYERAMISSTGRIGGALEQSTAPETFRIGHENFLTWSVQTAWFYGAREQAQRWYTRLGRLYSTSQPDRMARYSQPLDSFVMTDFKMDMHGMADARRVIVGLIRQALVEGFANDNAPAASQRLALARRLHTWFQNEKIGERHFMLEEGRMSLHSFADLAAGALQELMIAPLPLALKVRIWENPGADPQLEALKRRIYDTLRPAFAQMGEQIGQPAAVLFPEPTGMAEYRKSVGKKSPPKVDSGNSAPPARVESE